MGDFTMYDISVNEILKRLDKLRQEEKQYEKSFGEGFVDGAEHLAVLFFTGMRNSAGRPVRLVFDVSTNHYELLEDERKS